ncbi:unnamed protein product [Owenia fusiformis]|uniref:Glycine cleavage system H protein n=1 Tax=Owenia fusiformis TaxID=6347 RepID=A0A8J1XSM9_OWEFU|nr:unnamed protein product [Owenia fusiformis]
MINRSISSTNRLLGARVYAESHEWVLMNENTATVGISDHAQGMLGDVVFVDLPEVGDTAEAGNACATVESVKAASDIYAPVSGEIVEVNTALENEPSLINTSPLDNGWLFKVKVQDGEQLSELKSEDQYLATIEDE